MKLSKKTVLTVMTGLLLLPGIAAASNPVSNMAQIGSQPFQMVESAQGTFFMSSNGRYVIKGEMQDLWEDKRIISTVDDLVASMDKVNLKSMNITPDSMMTLQYGTGPNEVYIFVAPGCVYCKQALAQMDGLGHDYTFHVVPLPIMGPSSEDAVRRIACEIEDKNSALALRSLIVDNYEGLQQYRQNCDLEKVGRSLVMAQLLGVQSVPFIIDHHNRISTGAPQDLATHLNR